MNPLGGFMPGSTSVHHLDPRVKLGGAVVLTCATLITQEWRGTFVLGLTAIGTNLAAQARVKDLAKMMLALGPFYLITIVVHSVLGSGESVLSLPYSLTVTWKGIERGIFFSVKIIILVAIARPLLQTSHPSDWSRAMEAATRGRGRVMQAMRRFSLTLGLAIRFLPLLLAEAERIRTAQVSRGLNVDGGLIAKIRSLRPLVLPLLTSTFHKANLIATAMQARGFELDRPRTDYKPLRFNRTDVAAGLIAVGLSVLALI